MSFQGGVLPTSSYLVSKAIAPTPKNNGHGYTERIPQSSTPYFISKDTSLELKEHLSSIFQNR